MKYTGFVRKVDILGRVVLAKERRRTIHLSVKDVVKYYAEGTPSYSKNMNHAATFAARGVRPVHFKGKMICWDAG